MLSILKMLSVFSGSRGPHEPDLPSLVGREFQLSVHQISIAAFMLLYTAYRKIFPHTLHNTMSGICVTGALGPYFHTCQSPTLQNCFGKVMHNLGNSVALIFSSLDFSIPQSLVQTLEFGILLTLVILTYCSALTGLIRCWEVLRGVPLLISLFKLDRGSS